VTSLRRYLRNRYAVAATVVAIALASACLGVVAEVACGNGGCVVRIGLEIAAAVGLATAFAQVATRNWRAMVANILLVVPLAALVAVALISVALCAIPWQTARLVGGEEE